MMVWGFDGTGPFPAPKASAGSERGSRTQALAQNPAIPVVPCLVHAGPENRQEESLIWLRRTPKYFPHPRDRMAVRVHGEKEARLSVFEPIP